MSFQVNCNKSYEEIRTLNRNYIDRFNHDSYFIQSYTA